MSIYNLEKLFNPSTIAVIGAGERPGSVGSLVVRNLQSRDHSGTIYPVNPQYTRVHGLSCVPDISQLPLGIDLAVITTAIHRVPDILSACAQQGVHTAILVSDSNREPPHIRTEIENHISNIARKGKIRVIGPNSMGFVNTSSALNLSFSETIPLSGRMAFVSQSSSLFNATLDMAFKEQLGFSYFISAGSMVDVDFGDLVDYLGTDDHVGSILLCIQDLKNPRKFLSAARSVSPAKPIVVLKPGYQTRGVCLTADNMETPAFEDAVYKAAFKRAGIVSVASIDELFDCAELMAKQPRPAGDNLVVISNGGTPGAEAVEVMASYEMPPHPLLPKTLHALDEVLPPYWSRENPINLFSGAGADNYAKAVSLCLNDRSINALLIIMVPEPGTCPAEVAGQLVAVVRHAGIPILAAWCGGRDMDRGIELFNVAGIPTFRTPEKAIAAFSHLIEYNRNQATALEIPAKLNRHLTVDRESAQAVISTLENNENCFLATDQTSKLLGAYGIPLVETRAVTTEDQALEAAQQIGYPVTVKFSLNRLPQVYDTENARVDLRTPEELKSAFHLLKESMPAGQQEGIRIQSYISRPDYKLYLGIKKDKKFGPVLLFGVGGIYSLVIGERNLGLPPLNRLLARRLMEKTRAFELLKRYRDRAAANLEQLEELLIRLSQLAVDIPQIQRLDIHPVVVKNSRTAVLDALVHLTATSVRSPLHLVISPYPAHQEATVMTRHNLPLHIRPVKPEDAPLFIDFIKTLSDTTIYYRFFRYVRKFTAQQIHRFTAVDYDRQIALIALSGEGNEEKMQGVIRIIGHPDGKDADFYIAVSDDSQGQGIGWILLYTGLKAAFNQGYQTICGIVLPENEGMKKLAKKAGFQVKFNFSDKVFDLRLDSDTFSGLSFPTSFSPIKSKKA